MTDDLNAIVNRLERLERQRSWLIGIGAFLLVGLGSNLFLWWHSRTPRVWSEIRTERMVLVGEDSAREGGELFLRGHDPVLVLRSSFGSRAVLGSEGLELYDAEGNRRVWLHDNQGEPTLALSEKGNQLAVSVARQGVFIWDQKGHFRASLACKEEDVGLLLLDAAENTRIMVSNIHSPDETEIHILNNKEKSIWSAP